MRAYFSQYKSAKTLYDAVVARYSSPATAALSRLILPYMDHFLSVSPTTRTVDLLEERLLAAEKSIVAVGASRGDARAPVFEGCSPSTLLPSIASTIAVVFVGTETIGAASASSGRRHTAKWGYAMSTSDEGECYLCVPPDPGIEAAALGAGEAAALGASASAAPGAGESSLSGTTSAQALHTFTLDSGASRSFFRDRTTLTPLSRLVAVFLADPSGGPVLARFSTVLPCSAPPSGTLSGLYLPSFSTNLVSGADLQDGGVD
ncbi:unnamed protein product [Closterium sp. NIES-65]|nr:unnamed protein product [Closterium sp. NIES-65]